MEDKELKKIDEEIKELKPEEPKKTAMASAALAIFDFVKTIAIILVLAFIIRFFLIQPYIVDGQSMEPTFHNNDYLITEKISYRLHTPQRGDVVIFHPPDNPEVNYIKRIIGLPGDVVEIKDQAIFVNGNRLGENSYLPTSDITNPLRQTSPITIGQKEYYVMGDNRDHSRDSRDLGPIPIKNIVSHVWIRLWPLNQIRFFEEPVY